VSKDREVLLFGKFKSTSRDYLKAPALASGLSTADAKHFSSYDFKHNGVTNAAQVDGATLTELSAVSGVSPSTLDKRYLHPNADHARALVERREPAARVQQDGSMLGGVPQVTLDEGSHFIRSAVNQVVVPATDDDQSGRREKFGESLPDRNRADRVGVAPEQQHRCNDVAQSGSQVGAIRAKPIRRSGVLLQSERAPIGGAEWSQVHAAGRHRQHQVPHELRLFECRQYSDHATHRLSEKIDGTHDFTRDPTDELFEARHVGFGRGSTEPGPTEESARTWMLQAVRDRSPEVHVSRGARQEHEGFS